ncbi:MAG: carboxypeptidase-like regulatory domain-containing protein [Bacteroidia bacterium]|nr:carboxypeptidase-like regulatory domain-containing protein [Bacteroidia bacterium]
MFRRILLVVVAVVLANGVFGQSGTLKGKVVDKATGEAIPFAAVVVVSKPGEPTIAGTTSDIDGFYTLKPVPVGKWCLMVQMVGYSTLQMDDVVVKADKIDMFNLELSTKTTQISEVQVIAYKIPLIDKDNTQTGETVTSDDIEKMPGRSVMQVASTVAGVSSRDGNGVGSIRGARGGNTYFVDGIRVSGSSLNIPKSAQEQVQVITGGMSAKYGDVTGGVVSISTKNTAPALYGSFDLETNEMFGQTRRSLVNFTLSGPLLKVKQADGKKRTMIGFFLSGDLNYGRNPTHWWYNQNRIKQSVRDELVDQPIIPNAQGVVQYKANYLDYVDSSKFDQIKFQSDYWSYGATFVPKITINFSQNIDLTLGGSFDYSNGVGASFGNSMFNWENNSTSYGYSWRAWARFTQRFADRQASKDETSSSVIKNAYYQIQAQVERSKSWGGMSQRHGFNMWDYGYIGAFKVNKVETFEFTDTVSGYPTGVWRMNNWKDVLVDFKRSEKNPELANVTSQYLASYNNPVQHYENLDQISAGGGLLNGGNLGSVYGIFNLPGAQVGGYGIGDNTVFRITAAGSADIKNHEISFGFEFEQNDSRGWSVNAMGLWGIGRQLTNKHLEQLDLSNPMPVIVAGVFQDTIRYNRQYNKSDQSKFDASLRKALNKPVDGTEFIDLYAQDPSILDITFFSPDELLNNGGSLVGYRGYDQYGNRLKKKPSFEDFFTEVNPDSTYRRLIGPSQPIYAAGYIQDKFAFNDLIFNVGIRIDRYDLNQYVLSDPYSLYATKKVSDVPKSMNPTGEHPSNMGKDFVVYVDDVTSPSTINGYRNGSTWYNAYGVEVNDPSVISSSTGIAPYLVHPEQQQDRTITSDAFEDYTPQVSIMPRVAFSFPISDEALFQAHYDILTSRPGGTFDPTSYFYLANNPGASISNPNMKPQRTIDYELGFQQRLTNSSSLKLAAYYREQRDMAQAIRVLGAYPVDYFTSGNIDFGTSKGLTVSYDLRRSGNLSLRANYTLGFSSATGSNEGQMLALLRTNQPNLRILSPTDWDQRHKFNLSLDYRFFEGKDYNGPKLFGKEIFSNTGANFTVVSGSGYPFSRTLGVNEPGLKGSMNGSRLPWTTVIKMRVDKDFNLTLKKKGEQGRRRIVMNLYLDVENLLNTKNVSGVYSATGDPMDDGYLASPKMQQNISTQLDPEAFKMYYQMRALNNANYMAPRSMRIGLSMNF